MHLKPQVTIEISSEALTDDLNFTEGQVFVGPDDPHQTSLQSIERENELLILVVVHKSTNGPTVYHQLEKRDSFYLAMALRNLYPHKICEIKSNCPLFNYI